MNELKQDAPPVPAAATNAVHEIGRRRLLDRYAADAARAPLLLSLSNADKYRWIRANRGNFAIADAFNNSDRDDDFDARIEAAMRISVAGRHYSYSR